MMAEIDDEIIWHHPGFQGGDRFLIGPDGLERVVDGETMIDWFSRREQEEDIFTKQKEVDDLFDQGVIDREEWARRHQEIEDALDAEALALFGDDPEHQLNEYSAGFSQHPSQPELGRGDTE